MATHDEFELVQSWSSHIEERISEVFSTHDVISFDVEAAITGRAGTICIIQMGTMDQCFIFDVLDQSSDSPMICWLKKILEGPKIKVVHDCTMDSDMLFHCLGISLNNVHDTSAWDASINNVRKRGIVTVLTNNGLPSGPPRDNSIYDRDYAIWKKRPIAPNMLARAAQDVKNLLALHEIQLKKANALSNSVTSKAKVTQAQNLQARDMSHFFPIKPRNVGRFIGPRGANIIALQKETNTIIQKQRPSNYFEVYYNNASDLQKVQRTAAGNGY